MRDIKFRAWIYDKGMLHQGVASLWAFFYTLDRATKYELMQYTGLSDKNGTPIYEGDILKFPEETTTALQEVCWGRDSWRTRSPKGWFGNPKNWSEAEVIGNIMENKEKI